MDKVTLAQAQLVHNIEVYSSKAKVVAGDVKSRSLALAKDTTVQVTVASAATGTVLLGCCGGALGVVVGGGTGAFVGLPFVLLTFGLSVPLSAAAGGGIAGATGVAVGGAAGCATGGAAGYTVFTWRREITEFINACVVKLTVLRDATFARTCAALSAARGRLQSLRAAIVLKAHNATSAAKQKARAVRDFSVRVAKDPQAQVSVASAAAGGLVCGGAGGAIGLTGGAVVGGIIGVVPALFTFGLSIPFFAATGGAVGLCVGTAVGGTTGAVGSGGVAYGVYGKRAEIRKGVTECSSYAKQKVGEVKALMEAKRDTLRSERVPDASTSCPPQSPKKSRPVGS